MAAPKRSTRQDTIDLQDEVSARLKKASGICALASLLPERHDEIPTDSLQNAMWAARDLMQEAESLIEKYAMEARRGR